MAEEWRLITGFQDYTVSSEGRVKRVVADQCGRSGRILKQYAGRYCSVTLYRDGKPSCVLVHRLVCAAFHGEPPSPDHHAAHNDGDGLHNRSSNLRWATPAENEADKITHGTSLIGRPSFVPVERRPRGERHGRHTMPSQTARGERAGRAKLTAEKVTLIRLDLRPRKQVAAAYGITVAMVGYIQRGISWAHVPMPITTGEQT